MLQEKLKTLDNVDVHLGAAAEEIIGNGNKVSAIKVKDRKSGESKEYPVEGVFVQIGLLPNSGLFKDELPVNNHGEIITDASGRTSIPGVYAAGDVTDVPYKQIVIAMGEGAKAALSAVDDRMRGLTPS